MMRRTFIPILASIALVAGVIFSAHPAGATRAHDVDPATIDPTVLALPQSVLPAGAVIDSSTVSSNTDADTSVTHQLHTQLFETWHRITGYRMDFHYTVQGISIPQAGFLTSIFPTAADAQAALANATDKYSIIALLGNPLPDPCPVDGCKGFYGPNPQDATQTGLVAIYTVGPILVEAATEVPATTFAQVKPVMEARVYAVASAEDVRVKAALSSGPSPTAAAATATTAPTAVPTDTPLSTPTPKLKLKCKKGQHASHGKCACKKGYKLSHGKCKKVKKHH